METKRHNSMTLRVVTGERFSLLKPKTWKQISMVTKMIGVTVTLLLGAISVGGYAAYLVSKSQLEAEIAFTGEQLVTSLAGSITTVIGKEGSEADLQVGLNKLLSKDESNRILDANILGKDFMILASKDSHRIKTPYTGPIHLNELDKLMTFRSKDNSTLIATPVIWGKGDNVRILGYVAMEFSNAPIERARRQTIVWFSLIFVLAVTITAFLTRIVMSKLLKPVVELGKASRALAQGDPDYKLEEPQGHDELALATGSFLTMREIQQVLFKFSNPALVDLILKGRAPDKAEEVKLTVGFGDGVKFTDWSTKNPAPVIAEMLIDYFTLAGRMVVHHGGIVEKFIGDAIMDSFGLAANESLELYAQNAIKAKLCVQQCFQIAHWAFKHFHGRKPMEFRFGIATGPCVVGPIGAKGVKLEYTLIGSTVNLAARLEGEAASSGLLVDRFTYLNAKDGGMALLTSEPREIEAKGFKDRIIGYDIIGLEDPAEDEMLRVFLRSFFAQPDTLSIFRLTPEQIPEFQAEVEKRLMEPIRLPVPKQRSKGH